MSMLMTANPCADAEAYNDQLQAESDATVAELEASVERVQAALDAVTAESWHSETLPTQWDKTYWSPDEVLSDALHGFPSKEPVNTDRRAVHDAYCALMASPAAAGLRNALAHWYGSLLVQGAANAR